MPSLSLMRNLKNDLVVALIFFMTLLLTKLGFWQLTRALEKNEILEAAALRQQEQARFWQPGEPLPQSFQKVTLSGHYLPTLFYLDNQHHAHQLGFNILSPFLLGDESGEVVMIDRGWVAAKERVLPQIERPEENLNLKGVVYYPKAMWLLGSEMEARDAEHLIVERINPNLFANILQKKVHPFIIRLDKEEKYGFVREWQLVSMLPERHYAYAFQWFLLAILLIAASLVFYVKKRE